MDDRTSKESGLHIAYVSYEFPPDTGWGGIGTYTYQMAKLLNGSGHRVEVFSASLARSISSIYCGFLVHRIKVFKASEFKDAVLLKFSDRNAQDPFNIIECAELGADAEVILRTYPSIPAVIRLHTPAVLVTRLINSQNSFFVKLRYVMGALRRGKLDMGYWSRQDKRQFSDPEYLITERAGTITAPSEAIKSWAHRFWHIEENRIKVFPNPFVPKEDLLNIPIETDTKRITFIGRLNVLKGLVSLTGAIPIILQKYPEWKVRFIGSDHDSHVKDLSMKNWIKSRLNKYTTQIEWVDWIPVQDLPHYLSQTDIVVIPSLFESFSYVCAEAMSAGRGIVGSNNGGMPELLAGHGITVNPRSVRQIAKAMEKMIRRPEIRRTLGEGARARILAQDFNNKIAEQAISTYQSLVNKT